MQHVLSFPPQERHSAGEVVTKRLCCSFLLTVAFLALLSGYLLGRYAPNRQIQHRVGAYKAEIAQRIRSHNDAAEYLEHKILAEKILQYHRELTSQENENKNGSVNFQQAVRLKEHFEKHEFDMTTPPLPVNVLLTYYQPDAPNQISVVDEQNNVRRSWHSLPMKVNLTNDKDGNLFSKTIKSNIVYTNYGNSEDFLYLNSLNISVLRSTVLTRIKYYTTVYDVVSRALEAGASAVLLFSDPLHSKNDTFFLSPALLGRIQARFKGSKKSDDCVPVHVIKASDAENLLNEMSMQYSSPLSWKGKLRSLYPPGPGLANENWRLRIETNLFNIAHTYYNIISAIRGREEPDRYVLLGSNREMLLRPDADHLGSTAAMMELARVFGQLRITKGWVPRRSVLFCSWGLQGDGHFNSEMWAQQYADLLRERAVAYLSMETAVIGNEHLTVEAAPLLERAVREASALVPNPSREEIAAGYKTVLDSWTRYSLLYYNSSLQVQNVRAEGDYQMFLHEQGVPSLDFGYTGSMAYRDTNFTVHRAVTELWALLVWTLSDSAVLPLQVTDYSSYIRRTLDAINATHKRVILQHKINLDLLENSVNEFTLVAELFEAQIKEVDQTNLLRMRIMNDKLVHLEKTLLCSSLYARHKVLWEGATRYTGFGQLHVELMELEGHGDPSDVLQQISMLSDCLHSAVLLLQDSVLAITSE